MAINFIISRFVRNYDDVSNKKVREAYGLLSGIVGIIVNLILFTVELFIGLFINSIAVTADAFHNLADVTASLITIVGFKLSNKPADKEHPFGHGRVEYIAAMLVSALILIVGLEFIKSSVTRILHPEEVKFSTVSFIIMVIAIPLKIWLGCFNKTLGKKISSSTLKAAGADALNDVAILSGVLLSLIVSLFIHISIDGYVGIIVALFIIFSGYELIKETLNPLLGEAPDPAFVKELVSLILKYDYINGVHDIVIHNYGPGRCMASLHAEVPGNVSIMKIHDVIDTAEKEISEKLNMFLVIHMDPVCFDSEEVIETRKEIVKVIKSFPMIESIHDFRIVGEGENKTLVFDAVLNMDYKISSQDEVNLRADLDKSIKVLHPNYNTVITLDYNYSPL
ncbi:MAG: cation diffusion facilitator family transporter [Bacillota bacterium]|nr:cation diffusion facilitator family transporter [Bacillota bacterium]